MKNIILVLISALFLYSCRNEPEIYNPITEEISDLSSREWAGGDATIFNRTSFAYSFPMPNLDADGLSDHNEGDAIFEFLFTSAPNPINPGLGPIFNNRSCISCHPRDGRAPFPTNLESRSGFFLRVSIPGEDANGAPLPVPGYGTQIQNFAIFGYQPEATFAVSYTDIVEKFEDGTEVILKKPHYRMNNTYTTVPSNILISPRIGPPIFGLGLLEYIPDNDILAAQDEFDRDNDGISGRVNRVYDIVNKTKRIGRFGWKGNTATLLEQCAGAFNGDMGITSYLMPIETGFGQSNGSDGFIDDPEIDNNTLDKVAFYCQTLAVPASREHNKTSVKRGAKIFEEINCAKCHTPKQRTGYSPIKALANQTFYPYTDMLIHDMGENLADGRPDFLANGQEWRTRPLWGIGLQFVVNGHTEFLHDGRAKNLTEAILWHGGEAENSKKQFKKLKKEDRENLLSFLNSL